MLKKIFSLAPFFYFTFLPFIFCQYFLDNFELPKVIFFSGGTFLLTALYLTGIITGKVKINRLSRIGKTLLFFNGILLLSSLLNGFTPRSLWGQYLRYQGLYLYLAYFVFFIIFANRQHLKIRQNQISKSVSCGGWLVALTIIGQAILIKILGLDIYHYNARMTGFLGNPNYAAGFLALSFPFNRPQGQPLQRVVFWVYLLAIYLTGSRAGLLAFMAVTIFLIIDKVKRKWPVVLITIAISLGLLLVSSRPISSFDNRMVIWQKAILAAAKKPLLGWGLENFETGFRSVLTRYDFDLAHIRVDKAHNEILEILVSGGLLALIVYLYLLKEAFRIFWQNRRSPGGKTNLLVLGTYLILALTNVLNINEYLFFYLLLTNAAVLKEA